MALQRSDGVHNLPCCPIAHGPPSHHRSCRLPVHLFSKRSSWQITGTPSRTTSKDMPRSILSFVVNGACNHHISPSSFCRSVARLQFASQSFSSSGRGSLALPGLFLSFSDATSFSRESFLHCTWTIHLYGDLNGGGRLLQRINLGIGVPGGAVVLVLHGRETET